MKKIVSLLLLMCPVLLSAQAKGNLELGFGVGRNGARSNIKDEFYPGSQFTSNINLHASADYSFSNRWSVKAKLIYDTKGWDDGVLFYRGGELWHSEVDLNYLTVPVMLNYHFGTKRNWYLNFGPYFGFLMAAGEKHFDADIKDAFRPIDPGIALGIGVKIPVSKYLKVYLEYDGQFGFNSIYRDNNVPETTNARVALNIGMNFLVF